MSMQEFSEQLQCWQSSKPPKIMRIAEMKDVAYSFTMFHALAALAILGFMLFSVVQMVRRKH